MGNLSVINGGIIANKEEMPSIDLRYGPYTSISAAHAALSANGYCAVGLTVGIINGTSITEYWYQGGTSESNLVKKQSDVTIDAYTKAESDNKYQPKGDYQPAGNYQPAGDYATKTELNSKVDKVTGKGLSTNDYTNEEKQKVANALVPADIAGKANASDVYAKSETYNKTELNDMITTPNQEYVTVTATAQTTAVTDLLPATGAADTTYRVGCWDGTQYDDTCYSEYAWNGSAYIKLSTKSQVGEVYDISANHADTKYSDLAAALGTNGANIPQSLRKGGMSVKFVQSSDNKYVQARCMAHNFTTDITQWQRVDATPTQWSKNLVESGGVKSEFNKLRNNIDIKNYQVEDESIEIKNNNDTSVVIIQDSNIDFNCEHLRNKGEKLLTEKSFPIDKELIPSVDDALELHDNSDNTLIQVSESETNVNTQEFKHKGNKVIVEKESNLIYNTINSATEEIIIGESEYNWALKISGEHVYTKYPINDGQKDFEVAATALRPVIENLDLSDYPINGNVVCIGDSTVAGYLNNTRVSSLLTINGNLNDISMGGDTIAGQTTKWNNLSQSVKENVNYVFIEIGLNDMLAQDTVRYDEYQNLVLTIRNDAPNAKIILCTMSPALQRFKDFPDTWEMMYNNWIETNFYIKNKLFYGADTFAWFHSIVLSDSFGNLLPQYEFERPDHIHPNVAGVKVIAWSWLSAINK